MNVKEKIFRTMRNLVLLVGLLVAISSCQNYRDIVVADFQLDGFQFKNTTSAQLNVSALVDNPTRATLSIIEGEAVIKKEGKDFIVLTIPQTYSVAPVSKQRVLIDIEASVLNPIEIIATGLNFASWNLKQFTVDGKITVKSNKGFKKVFRLKDEPLEDVLKALKQI